MEVRVRAIIDEIDRLHAAARADIDAAQPTSALSAMNDLMTRMRGLADSDVEHRTHIAGRVWDTERLSLAALAERVGVSKSRAEQMIKEVRRKRELE